MTYYNMSGKNMYDSKPPTIAGSLNVTDVLISKKLVIKEGDKVSILSGGILTGLESPINDSDASNKNYVDSVFLEGVTGPISSTDNALVRFDGTSGKVIQDSLVSVSDSGNLTTIGNLQSNLLWKYFDKVSLVSTPGIQYTAENLISGLIDVNLTSIRTDTLPSTSSLHMYYPSSVSGGSLDLYIGNMSPTHTLTIGASLNWTLVGKMTVKLNESVHYKIKCTDVLIPSYSLIFVGTSEYKA